VDLKFAFRDSPRSDLDYKKFEGHQRYLLGTNAYFQIAQDSVTLPSNSPTWEGTFGARGSGKTTTHTFNGPASSNDTDFKTVITSFFGQDVFTKDILACRYVLGIHSNASPSAGFTDGHAWISVTDWNGGISSSTSYGLWPDEHPNTVNNGDGSDVRVGMEQDTGAYARYYLLSPSEYNDLRNYINAHAEWTYFNTCANWAEGAVSAAVSENVESQDRLIFGTPRAVSESISDLESEEPTQPTAPRDAGVKAESSSSRGSSSWNTSSFIE
jgi:hypothetical protein